MYPIVKQFHVILVIISIAFFQIRYWRFQVMGKPSQTWLKILPHGIDTLLLLTGLWVAIISGFTPMNSPWLMVKLLALLVYIGFGALAMKKSGGLQFFSYLLASLTVIYMISVAMNKAIWPF
ncbi:SirB2 family protein [Marinicella litoralis]|uniref:Putative membrane protein SirB2 n=1 Tax=Marinicella litoralis TaxID=644220 RepID=A0A4R6XSN5_9GAMM|nr:SirB2 family protein [Marinicella litoralis]TDR20413.1 putative membrane protein SirB2 [Marinicella litoralis]